MAGGRGPLSGLSIADGRRPPAALWGPAGRPGRNAGSRLSTLPPFRLCPVQVAGFPLDQVLKCLLTTPVQFVLGWRFHRGAFRALRSGRCAPIAGVVPSRLHGRRGGTRGAVFQFRHCAPTCSAAHARTVPTAVHSNLVLPRILLQSQYGCFGQHGDKRLLPLLPHIHAAPPHHGEQPPPPV